MLQGFVPLHSNPTLAALRGVSHPVLRQVRGWGWGFSSLRGLGQVQQLTVCFAQVWYTLTHLWNLERALADIDRH
jgi:hypothetical protein